MSPLIIIPIILSAGICQEISANKLLHIETASNGIAEIIDSCSENLAVRFKLVIVGNNSDLYEISGRIMKILNYSLTVQTVLVNINKTYEFLKDSESQVFLFSEEYFINEPFTYEIFYNRIILIDFYFPREIEKNFKYPSYAGMRHYHYHLIQSSDLKLILMNEVKYSEASCQPDLKIVNVYSYTLDSWKVELSELFQLSDNFFGCSIRIFVEPLYEIDLLDMT